MSTPTFNPATIAEQSGKVFFITGGTTGLGAECIFFLAAKRPAHIFFSGRNQQRATELIEKVQHASPDTRLTFLECDLSSLASVQSCARQVLAQADKLDVLMCNAGIMATPPSLSVDGYETQFATNHLGHALLIKLLLPRMLEAAKAPGSDVRIVNLTSVAYKATGGSGIEFDKLKTKDASYGPFYMQTKFVCYGQSKLANLLYATELAKRYPSIASVAVHPGFVRTNILSTAEGFWDRNLLNMIADRWVAPEEGAYTQTWAATTAKVDLVNGAYYEPVGKKTVPATKQAKDSVLAEKLWEWTEKELSAWN